MVLQNLKILTHGVLNTESMTFFQVHIPSALSSSGIPPIFSSTGHNIEFVLQTELPLVSSAFKMSGYTPAQVGIIRFSL